MSSYVSDLCLSRDVCRNYRRAKRALTSFALAAHNPSAKSLTQTAREMACDWLQLVLGRSRDICKPPSNRHILLSLALLRFFEHAS
eukprot:3853318-Pleurochrysis_carterae.AAC.1